MVGRTFCNLKFVESTDSGIYNYIILYKMYNNYVIIEYADAPTIAITMNYNFTQVYYNLYVNILAKIYYINVYTDK